MSSDKKRHLRHRLLFFFAGMILFVAPTAVLLTSLGHVLPAGASGIGNDAAQSDPTIHRSMCLRMPLLWAVYEPGKFLGRLAGNPLYALVFLLIPAAFFIGPLFCGWLCPGMMTEHLSRLVPSTLKINLKGAVDPAPVRYGFLAGYFVMASPFFKKSVCCGYCNWTWIEDTWSALFGKLDGVTGGGLFSFSTSAIITFLLTFVFLGVFMEGGRGWCNFLCPAGALQNLAHWLGAKLRFTYKLRFSPDRCNDCFQCVKACPAWAIVPSGNSVAINRHVCNGCKDCISSCPTGALAYERGGRS